MKRYGFVAVAVLSGLMIRAQTNAPGTLPTPHAPTWIHAERGDFDLARHEAVYGGHVRVDNPQLKLTCERLVADMPQAGGRPNHIVAETNVVIDFTDEKGQTNHATGDRAVYDYQVKDSVTNEMVTLTGNAKVEQGQTWLTGEPIVFNCVTRQMHAENMRGFYQQNLTGTPADTNAPPTKTNLPPATAENTNTNLH